MLKFNSIRLVQSGKFMYSHKHSFLPETFPNSLVHAYRGRNPHAYNLSYSRTNAKQLYITYQEPEYQS